VTRNIRERVAAMVARKEDAQIEAQRISHGWVTDINPDNIPPTTIMLGPGNHPAWTIDNAAYAVGDQVVAMHTGTAYVILGKIDLAAQTGTPPPAPVPAMELIATYVGDATVSTWKFGGGGNAMAADIPATFSHLWLRGRLSHNDASASLQGASLRFNGDSANNYRYLEDRTVGTGSGSGATETNTFNPDDAGAAGNRTRVVVGTGGGIDLFIPDYRGASGFTVYQLHYWAVRGTGSASFTGRRFSGRYDGSPITSIECSLGATGGADLWQNTTRLSLYGLQ
jgi:hypothetical protein